MSNLWRQTPESVWEPLPLDAPCLPDGVRLLRFGQGAESAVALLTVPNAPVRVNGLPVLGGLCVLTHRDEILVNDQRYYFSAESRPVVTVFRLDEGARRPTCPVCRGVLKDGESSVRCPGCARRYHQIEPREGVKGRTCWTYAASCRFCNHPTSLTGEASWRPEQEEEPVAHVH
jgi:hypothetical protein